jgi:hypothetical protein
MTLDGDDKPDDDLMASLASLRTFDISQRRSRQLRRRCHAMLQAEPRTKRWPRMVDEAPFRRVIVPALGCAWCLAYLVEIIRFTATIYGYLAAT